MDIHISRWILEYLLRQPIDDRAIYPLIEILPLPNDDDDDGHLTKAALLRRIYSEMSSGSVSEKTLDCMEIIEQCDSRNGVPVLESMKEAYCAVAAHCTARYLKDNIMDYDKYSDSVTRIWKGRIRDMEKSHEVALLTDKLKHLGKIVMKSLSSASLRNDILMTDTLNDALKSLGVFYAEAIGQMGPSFLEIVAKKVSGIKKEAQVSQVASQIGEIRVPLVDVSSDDSNANNGNNLEESSDSHVAGDPTEESDPSCRNMKPATISSSLQKEQKMGELQDQNSIIADVITDSIDKGVEGVQVNAATLSYNVEREAIISPFENRSFVDVDVAVSSSFDIGVEGSHAKEAGNHSHAKEAGNHCAVSRVDCTFEAANDLSEPSHERPLNHHYQLRKCPTVRLVSPSKGHESHQLGRKRAWKWNPEEEQALRDVVSKYGRGC